jgi:hypothetical protein
MGVTSEEALFAVQIFHIFNPDRDRIEKILKPVSIGLKKFQNRS